MKVQKLPIEETAKFLVIREKLLEANKAMQEAQIVVGQKRSVAMKLEEDLELLKRETAIKYGGNTNWKVDSEFENVVLPDEPTYGSGYSRSW